MACFLDFHSPWLVGLDYCYYGSHLITCNVAAIHFAVELRTLQLEW